MNDHVKVLEWWKNLELPINYSKKALFYISCGIHINFRELWANSRFKKF
jgi:hypothetical protein